MVESLKAAVGAAAIAGLSLCLHAGAVHAEVLPDPTRPPSALEAIQEAGTANAVAAGPVLQSVLVSSGRKMAVISGQTLSVGDKFGDARLVKITETEVELRSDSGVQTLKLFPNVEKRLSNSRAESKKPAASKVR